MKDASASAVYGVRGANGVILITTKKGSVGKPQVNVRTEFGFTQPTKRPQMLGSAEWAELYNEAYGSQFYSPEDIENTGQTQTQTSILTSIGLMLYLMIWQLINVSI